MPKFHYIALDQNGQETAGDLDAASEADAINQLRQAGLYPTSVAAEGQGQAAAIKKRAKSSTKGKAKVVKVGANAKVKSKSLMIFTRQLATLIDSGLPLLRGLTVLGRQEPNLVMKGTINTLADNVQTGSTFSESLQQYPRIFNKLYINMVKAGELGGVLELVLNRLAEYQEKAQKLKNKIVAAMVYPIIVMFIAAAIMVFLMMVIVPRFETIFEDMLGSKDKLPELTKWVIGFSRNMFEYKWYLLGGLVGSITAWRALAATKGGRRWIDRMKLKLPLFGDVQRKTAISRFTRTWELLSPPVYPFYRRSILPVIRPATPLSPTPSPRCMTP
jgi:type IV pilus assembly protein PilC